MSRPAEAGDARQSGGWQRSDRPSGRRRSIERFTRAERYVHRTTATLMLTLIATGLVLYLPSLSVRVGHRQTVALIHLYCGFALPIPMAAGLLSRAYRADVRRLSRHTETDREWLREHAWRRERARELALPVGKFNAGQKLNAAFQCGAILVMVGTGTLMWFPHLVGVSARTGATFVHDWLALAIGFVVIGHVWFALTDRQARIGMRTGWVTRSWAQIEHRGWAAEVAATEAAAEAEGEASGPEAVSEAEDRAARGEAGARDRADGSQANGDRAVHQARAWDR